MLATRNRKVGTYFNVHNMGQSWMGLFWWINLDNRTYAIIHGRRDWQYNTFARKHLMFEISKVYTLVIFFWINCTHLLVKLLAKTFVEQNFSRLFQNTSLSHNYVNLIVTKLGVVFTKHVSEGGEKYVHKICPYWIMINPRKFKWLYVLW
jgi:hypothetical protein